MPSSLQERAAAAAGKTSPPDQPAAAELSASNGATPVATPPEPPTAHEPDIIGQITDEQLAPIEKVPMVPVWRAWAEVRREVRAIGKNQLFDGGRAGRFQFRGADLVLNAFGPAMWRHGVNVIPEKVEPTYRDLEREGRAPQRECSVVVTWRIYGPLGDSIVAQSAGEAMDTAGRATSKAQTVALRCLFLAAGTVPTEDPERTAEERGTARIADDETYRAEILDPSTSLARIQQIGAEAKAQQRRALYELAVQTWRNRRAAEQPAAPASTGDPWKDAWAEVLRAGQAAGKDEAALRSEFPAWEPAGGLMPDDAGVPLLTAFAAHLRGGA